MRSNNIGDAFFSGAPKGGSRRTGPSAERLTDHNREAAATSPVVVELNSKARSPRETESRKKTGGRPGTVLALSFRGGRGREEFKNKIMIHVSYLLGTGKGGNVRCLVGGRGVWTDSMRGSSASRTLSRQTARGRTQKTQHQREDRNGSCRKRGRTSAEVPPQAGGRKKRGSRDVEVGKGVERHPRTRSSEG